MAMLVSLRRSNVWLQLLVVIGGVYTTVQDEITDNTLPVVFADVTKASWQNTNKAAKFKTEVSTLINGYCPSNLDKCSLKFWNETRQFSPRNVNISGYATKGSNLEVRFFTLLPSGSDIRKNSKSVVPGSTLEELLWNKKSQMSTAVGLSVLAAGKSGATGSGSKPEKFMNLLMIPISVGVLVVVCILAFCLHMCHKSKMKSLEIQRRKQLVMKKKSQKQHLTPVPEKKTVAEGQPKIGMKNQGYYADKNENYMQGSGDLDEVTRKQEEQPHKKKHRKKKSRKCRDYEEYDNEGNSTLETDEHNQLPSDVETEQRDTTENNAGVRQVRERGQRRTRKKKRRPHEHAVVDEGFDEANGTQNGDISANLQERSIIAGQLPPLRKPQNAQHNYPVDA